MTSFANAPERAVAKAYNFMMDDKGPPVGYLTVARRGDRGPVVTAELEVKMVAEPTFEDERGKVRRLPVGKRRFIQRGALMALEDAPGEWQQPILNDFHTVPVWSLDDVFDLLATRLEDTLPHLGFRRAEAFFVHGAVASDKKGDLLNRQRLLIERAAEVRGEKRIARAALVDKPNTIFCLDIENVDPLHFLPGVEADMLNREYVVRLLRAALPEWIAKSRFIVQLSASHFYKGLRARVFIQTSVPLTCSQLDLVLRAYLSGRGERTKMQVIDAAGIRPAQPVYINTIFESPKRGYEAAGTYQPHWFEQVPDPMNPRVFKVGLDPDALAVVPLELLANETVTVNKKTGEAEVKVRSDAAARDAAALGRVVASGDAQGALDMIDVDNLHPSIMKASGALLRMQPTIPEDRIKAMVLTRLEDLERQERAGPARPDRLARLAPGAMVSEVNSILRHQMNDARIREARKPSEGALAAFNPPPPDRTLEEGARATAEVIGQVIDHAKALRATKDALRALRSTAPVEERRALAERLERLAGRPMEVLSTSTGVGKSHALTEALSTLKGTPVRVALVVPDHELGAEHAERLTEAGVSVLHYQGLERLCRWMTLEGDPIALELQGAKTSLANVCAACPLAEGCPYPAQHKLSVSAQVTIIAGPRVMFEPLSPLIKRSQAQDEVKLRGNMQSDEMDDFAIDYMHLSGLTEGQFDLVVMDEAPVANWLLIGEVEHKQIVEAMGLIASDLMTKKERAELAEPIEAIRAAAGALERRFHVEAELDLSGAEAALGALREAAYGAYWKITAEELNQVFTQDNKTARRRVKAMLAWNKRLDALIEFSQVNPAAGYRRIMPNGIEYAIKTPTHRDWRGVTAMLMDATAIEPALRQFFPNMRMTDVRVKEPDNVKRYFVKGSVSATILKRDIRDGRLVNVRYPGKATIVTKDVKNKPIGPRVVQMIRWRTMLELETVGVVGQKALIDALQPLALERVEYLHYGKQRGSNRMKDVDTLILFGQMIPPPATMRLVAEALYGARQTDVLINEEDGTEVEPDLRSKRYLRVPLKGCEYPFRDYEVSGYARAAMQVAYDLMVTTEILQADGRARAIRRAGKHALTIIHVLSQPVPGVVYSSYDEWRLETWCPTENRGKLIKYALEHGDAKSLEAVSQGTGIDLEALRAYLRSPYKIGLDTIPRFLKKVFNSIRLGSY